MTMKLNFLKTNWCNLNWSQWTVFEKRTSTVPATSGLYRVKPINQNSLIYIGQTKNLKRRIASLISESEKSEMPFRDPHNGAPCLWVWQKEKGFNYEFSYTEFENSEIIKRTVEHHLFWKYRLEYGESLLCSFGRFHKCYKISSQRSKKMHGYKLKNEINQAGLKSHKPLCVNGNFLDNNWMELKWTEPKILDMVSVKMLEDEPSVYKIFTRQELLYIGETRKLKSRLTNHAKKSWSNSEVYFSCSLQDNNILPHQLKEIENDLIAGYYEQTKRPPSLQFQNLKPV